MDTTDLECNPCTLSMDERALTTNILKFKPIQNEVEHI